MATGTVRATVACVTVGTVTCAIAWLYHHRRISTEPTTVLDLIGNTQLVHVRSLSELTGCTILAKCEFLNPGGSSKDRVALAIVREAEASGALKPGGTIVEASAGSTGVSLAHAADTCAPGRE